MNLGKYLKEIKLTKIDFSLIIWFCSYIAMGWLIRPPLELLQFTIIIGIATINIGIILFTTIDNYFIDRNKYLLECESK